MCRKVLAAVFFLHVAAGFSSFLGLRMPFHLFCGDTIHYCQNAKIGKLTWALSDHIY